jgi:hypothetical protein
MQLQAGKVESDILTENQILFTTAIPRVASGQKPSDGHHAHIPDMILRVAQESNYELLISK